MIQLFVMENYKYNTKIMRKELKLNVTYCFAWWSRAIPPTLKDHYWTLMHPQTLFKSFNNNNTIIQKRQEQIPKTRIFGNNISVYIICCKIMENYMNNTKKRKFIVYVLVSMLVTPETAHFEISLLNADASLNAVQIIQ